MTTNSDFATISEVLVFKTNISSDKEIEKLTKILALEKGIRKWNIDLNDIDNVLRIESNGIHADFIIALLCKASFECEELSD